MRTLSTPLPPPPHTDVIDLSSGEDDSIILIQETADEEEEQSDPRGTHSNDALNCRDSAGRVLVNLNHPASERDVFLSPQLAQAVKAHQVAAALQKHLVSAITVPG